MINTVKCGQTEQHHSLTICSCQDVGKPLENHIGPMLGHTVCEQLSSKGAQVYQHPKYATISQNPEYGHLSGVMVLVR